ncbi:MAG: protein translocase subunit SecD [Chloroflexi bacterium]|jgi:preprotein translocase subunit SecD|nr:protein translocase subunit SecD [Chloroflexota bacterium]MDP6496528.1 protein translocase subunit SecD [Dehalococcoidia bacterium]MQG53819.1 protein translocase subunit SecD [SAR202 cluster bacterium]|tara:strand:+ start:5626 stop:7497 length:1872 start_codon:yes stop_codon:yes gene_type:complete
MRSRSIRLSISIILILGIAIAALGFKDINIDIPGFPRVERDGTGPLGLKLGLDLRGGGHLVYQADTGTKFDVTFADDVAFNDLLTMLQDLRFGDDDAELEGLLVGPTGVNRYLIRTDIMASDDVRRTGLNAALAEEFGLISLFQDSIIEQPTMEQMQGVLDNITGRVNRFGTEEPIIQIFGEDRIIVQLPGASGSVTDILLADPDPDAPFPEVDIATALPRILAESGYEEFDIETRSDREFKIQSNNVDAEAQRRALTSIITEIGQVAAFEVTSGIDEAKALIGQTARLEFKERTCENAACTTFTDADVGNPPLSGDDLSRAEASANHVGIGWVVNLQFNGRGSDIFSELTRRISTTEAQSTKRIAIIMDDRELLAPVSRAWIRDGRTQISGNFNREEARTLAIQIESGRLPVPLRLIQESDVDALLGSESLKNSLIAGLVGLGLVLIFVVIYYRMAGVVAAFSLVFYAVIVLAVFKMIPITLELAHIGGFILSIGMAVDANILIFERMKEEVRIGRTLASSMEVGFSRAWPAIRDSNISTMITCLVLLWFGDRLGGGLVTGVAISLLIGVAVSMFTAVVVSRNLLQLMAWVGLGGRINLFTPENLQRTSLEATQAPALRGER